MKTLACLSKLNSIPPQKFFLRKRNSSNFLFFLGFRRKLSEILANFLGHLCWNCLVSVQMNQLEKKSWIIFFLLWWWAEKIRLLAQKNGRFVETAFYFSTVTFWGKKLTCFSFFGAWMDFFKKIRPKTLGKSVRTAL